VGGRDRRQPGHIADTVTDKEVTQDSDCLKLEDSSRGSSKGDSREGEVKETPVESRSKETSERVK
jgi:hypothetical protein